MPAFSTNGKKIIFTSPETDKGKGLLMVTKKGKKKLHKTILEFSDIKYNQDLKESYFKTRTLEVGP